MPTLPHTGLQTPDQPRYEVTICRTLELLRGTPFQANISHGRRKIGTAENYGDGGSTEFVPHGSFTAAEFASFADACRFEGEPVGLSLLLDLLVEEFNITRSLRAQERHGRTMLREVTPAGTTITGTAVMPATLTDRRRLREALGQPLTPDAETQFWNGSHWEDLASASES
ncbi:hypothetical protein ABH940_003172 [Streptacidiphilus sp. BW17]|uniref:hypothetical protein n=1 Tax=unclassified Streptacidiphilus TaxID=2643834 RepID=UPI00351853B0